MKSLNSFINEGTSKKCPVGQDTFQPKIGFKTRFGMVANPFAEGTTQGSGVLLANQNRYYRRVAVKNLM